MAKRTFYIKIKNKTIVSEGLTLDKALAKYFNSQNIFLETPINIKVSVRKDGPFENFSVSSKAVVEFTAVRTGLGNGYPKL